MVEAEHTGAFLRREGPAGAVGHLGWGWRSWASVRCVFHRGYNHRILHAQDCVKSNDMIVCLRNLIIGWVKPAVLFMSVGRDRLQRKEASPFANFLGLSVNSRNHQFYFYYFKPCLVSTSPVMLSKVNTEMAFGGVFCHLGVLARLRDKGTDGDGHSSRAPRLNHALQCVHESRTSLINLTNRDHHLTRDGRRPRPPRDPRRRLYFCGLHTRRLYFGSPSPRYRYGARGSQPAALAAEWPSRAAFTCSRRGHHPLHRLASRKARALRVIFQIFNFFPFSSRR